jgi:hypothetical protein
MESARQARELDDTFLTSDPFGYFISRVAMLHHWARVGATFANSPTGPESEPPDVETAGDLECVGRPDLMNAIRAVFENDDPPQPGRMIVSAQVAVDAFAMRHHMAEALLRFFVACVDHNAAVDAPANESPSRRPQSLWARITDNREATIRQLLAKATDLARNLPDDGFARLVLPPSVSLTEALLPLAQATVSAFAEWTEYAVELLKPSELDTTAAHNKVKHGQAVRGRADMRVSLSLTGPNPAGDIELDAFGPDVSVDVFDRPVIEFLARPKLGKHKQGLELTQLRTHYRVLLADTAMLALVHGAMFHVAAHRHFTDHDLPQGLTIAPHPGFIGGAPKPNHAGYQVGLRFPITQPPGGGNFRPAGIGHPDGTFQTFTLTGDVISGRIVDSSRPETRADCDQDDEPPSDAQKPRQQVPNP